MSYSNPLSDLAEGIFGRMGELQQKQDAEDREQKLQTIRILADQAKDLEPGSRGPLLKLLGETLGVKGKMKDFWDAVSGMPNRSIPDQLGTIMNQAVGLSVGPEQARQQREDYKQQLLQPYRAEGTRPRSVEALPYKTPPSLEGKLIYRDPFQEKLQELEAQSGAHFNTQMALLDAREQAQGENAKRLETQRQANRLALQDVKSRQAQMALASDVMDAARLQGKTVTHDQAMQIAGQYTLNKEESQIDFLNANAQNRRATAELAIGQLQALGENQGMKPGEARRLALSERDEIQNIVTKHNTALGDVTKFESQARSSLNSINTTLQQMIPGAHYDPKTGKAVGGTVSEQVKNEMGFDEEQIRALAVRSARKSIDAYNKATSEAEGAEKKRQGQRNLLGNPAYSNYLQFGGDRDVIDFKPEFKSGDLQKKTKGVTKPQLPAGKQTPRLGTMLNKFERREVKNSSNYNIGDPYYDPDTKKTMYVSGFEDPNVIWLSPNKPKAQ